MTQQGDTDDVRRRRHEDPLYRRDHEKTQQLLREAIDRLERPSAAVKALQEIREYVDSEQRDGRMSLEHFDEVYRMTVEGLEDR